MSERMLGPDCADICLEHSGQVEKVDAIHGKLDLMFWLLGVMGVLILGVGAHLATSINGMNTTVAVAVHKISALESEGRRTTEALTNHIDKVSKGP